MLQKYIGEPVHAEAAINQAAELLRPEPFNQTLADTVHEYGTLGTGARIAAGIVGAAYQAVAGIHDGLAIISPEEFETYCASLRSSATHYPPKENRRKRVIARKR